MLEELKRKCKGKNWAFTLLIIIASAIIGIFVLGSEEFRMRKEGTDVYASAHQEGVKIDLNKKENYLSLSYEKEEE